MQRCVGAGFFVVRSPSLAYLTRDTKELKAAREKFALAMEADTDQAARELEDLRFYAGEQWPAELLLARQGQQANNGLPAIPARPTLVINKIREPIRQVQNEIRESDIGVELTPADDFGDLGITPDDTEVTLREGLVRRIIRDSHGQEAWNWCGDRADIAGRGYFAVMTRYLPGKTSDQEIYLDRIYNQNMVVGDPSRTQPDGSDAAWWFVGTFWLLDRFKAYYTKDADGQAIDDFAALSESDFDSLCTTYPNWFRTEGKQRAIRIVDHWYTEYESRTLVTFPDGQTAWEADLTADAPEGAETRTVVETHIKMCKIAGGLTVLERTDWAGPDMPIIETLGEELHPYDDQKRVEGMVRNARSSQQGINYLVSKFVESVGLSPIPRDRVDPEAIEGYENWWMLANTRPLPYLPHRTWDDQGRAFREPSQTTADPNIFPMAQGIALFDQFVKSTTAVPDPTLGNVDPSLKSGRAIRETVANAKGSTSNFVSNRIRSVRRAAEVINNLLYPIYGGRPGRVVRIMTGMGAPETMVIGDQQSLSPEMQQQMGQRKQALKASKLTEDAKFNIAIKITKNFETRRQQEYSMLGDLISSDPQQMMGMFGDLYLSSSDIPARKQLADRARMMLAPPIQSMLKAQEQGKQVDPATLAEIAQLKQQLQHAEQAMHQEHQAADGNVLKAQTELQKEQMRQEAETQRTAIEADKDIRMLEMKNAATLEAARISAAKESLDARLAAIEESIALGQQHAHEVHEAALDRAHQQQMGEQAHEQALEQTDQSLAGQAAMADQGQAHALEQQAAAPQEDGA